MAKPDCPMQNPRVTGSWLAVLLCLACQLSLAQQSDNSPPLHNVDGSYVREWLVLGPFPSPEMETDFLADVGGEANVRPKEGDGVTLNDGTTLKWTRFRSDLDLVNLEEFFGIQPKSVAYVYCELSADRDMETDVRGLLRTVSLFDGTFSKVSEGISCLFLHDPCCAFFRVERRSVTERVNPLKKLLSNQRHGIREYAEVSSINVTIRTKRLKTQSACKNRGFPVSASLGVYRREMGNDAGRTLQPLSAEKSEDSSQAPGAPIRVGGASPLRVATGGNAN